MEGKSIFWQWNVFALLQSHQLNYQKIHILCQTHIRWVMTGSNSYKMYLLAVCFSHIRLKWLLWSSQWWLYKVLLRCQEVFRSLTPEKRQQQTKGASALCHLRAAARCTLNPIVRNPRAEVGKPQFELKMQWSKQNVISLPFFFFLFFLFWPCCHALGWGGEKLI